jgi:hypothetical protein
MPSPVAAGAVQVIKAAPSRGVALTAVGDPGGPAVGRTRIDGALGAELPAPLDPTAVTVTVYVVRLIRPVMTQSVSVASVVVHVASPGLAVAT